LKNGETLTKTHHNMGTWIRS